MVPAVFRNGCAAWLWPWLAVAVAGNLPTVAHPAPAEVGSPAPNVLLHFVDGKSVELSEWLGQRPVYLKMWATWCSTCRAEMPEYKALYAQYGQDVAFFSVNAGFNDSIGDVQEFTAQYGLEIPAVIDVSGQIGQSYGLVATPHNILIDGAGNVAYLGLGTGQRVGTLLAELRQESRSGRSVPPPASMAADPGVPGEGDPAPPFSVLTTSGSEFTLGDSAAPNGTTWLLFFTTWCEWYLAGEGEDPEAANACEATRRALDAAFADPDRQPRVIGIASRMWTGTAELAEYEERFRPPYPLALDETNEVFQRYGVRQFPTLIAVDGGRIVRRLTGAITEIPAP